MMSKITIGIGLALIALGIGFYVATSAVTSLIPAFVGLPVAILGAVACCGSEKARKHAAHFAVMLTMLGAIAGLVRGVMGMMKTDGSSTAVAATLSMAALCIIHVIFSVRSFIAARKAREAAAVR